VAAPLLDLVFTYQFLKRLATPFEKWDAFNLGIIDQDGKILRKKKELKTPEEKSAWGFFDIMVANLKKLLGKFPGGKTRIASYTAALLLLREHKHNGDLNSMDEKECEQWLYENINYIMESDSFEEEIANVVGTGNIAGAGTGSQGEPPMNKKKMMVKKILKRRRPINTNDQK